MAFWYKVEDELVFEPNTRKVCHREFEIDQRVWKYVIDGWYYYG